MDFKTTAKALLKSAAVAAVLVSAGVPAAKADITIGVILSTTGPAAALGLPMKNALDFWPTTIAGEKLNVILLDDAGDPTKATTNARRLITEDKADVIVGANTTPTNLAISGVTLETETPHLANSPVPLSGGRDKWTFVMPQSVPLVGQIIVDHMKANKVVSVGYIGFSDSYGDLWMGVLKDAGAKAGLKVAGDERFARADTSVSGQVLKIVAANPDAVLIGASGTGAALPQIALRERGYKGAIYQTHGAVSYDFIRIAGASAEGTFLASGPVMVPENLPEGSAVKKPGVEFISAYEKKFGANTRSQFSAHINDSMLILQAAVPAALKTGAKPGTKEFRTALRDAIQTVGEIAATQGVYKFSATDHEGLDERARVLLVVKNGKFELVDFGLKK